jgi:rod shape determining protein RodA
MSQKKNASGLINQDGTDPVLLACYLGLCSIGCILVYSVGYGTGYDMGFMQFLMTPPGKQIIFFGLALLLLGFLGFVKKEFWRMSAEGFYSVGILLLILVLFFGKEINGARAWFVLPGFSFQPVELMKFGTALALSNLVSSDTFFKDKMTYWKILGIIACPVFLILLQPDAGSAIVFASFYLMLYREGLSGLPIVATLMCAVVFVLTLIFNAYIVIFGITVVAGIVVVSSFKKVNYKWLATFFTLIGLGALIWFFNVQTALLISGPAFLILLLLRYKSSQYYVSVYTFIAASVLSLVSFMSEFGFNALAPHQQDRINVWLRPDRCDPKGSAYNLVHSKLTIGSGGLTGKGFLEGTMTRMKYVPEQETDFIFTAVGEEFGFVGVFVVIFIYLLLIWRIIKQAEGHRTNFSRYYGYCVAGILFFHFFINIGMTIGLMPIIGIPLPFLSAGGSSLLGFTLLVGLFIRLDADDYLG